MYNEKKHKDKKGKMEKENTYNFKKVEKQK
jgi:hypothetical protein